MRVYLALNWSTFNTWGGPALKLFLATGMAFGDGRTDRVHERFVNAVCPPVDEMKLHLATTCMTTGETTEPRSFRVYAASVSGDRSTGDACAVDDRAGLVVDSTLRLLCSFHYWKNLDLAVIAARYPKFQLDVLVDSGAFTAASKGVRVSLAEYVRWLRRNAAHVGAYANLDVIGDSKATARNQGVLEAEGLTPIPAFHYGSDVAEFDRLVERYERIAVGGLVPMLKRPKALVPFLDDLFERGLRRRPGLKLHGFGVTTWSLMVRYPWDSVDSSAWVSGAKFASPTLFDPDLPGFVSVNLFDAKSCFGKGKLLRSYGVSAAKLSRRQTHDNAVVGALGIASMQRAEEFLSRRVYASTGQPARVFNFMRDASVERSGRINAATSDPGRSTYYLDRIEPSARSPGAGRIFLAESGVLVQRVMRRLNDG